MSEKTDLQKAQDRVKELEKELSDIKQSYQIVMLRLVNYIQAVDSSTTLVKDNLRNIVSNIK
jgi:uncharacterized protein (UPF0335 family)